MNKVLNSYNLNSGNQVEAEDILSLDEERTEADSGRLKQAMLSADQLFKLDAEIEAQVRAEMMAAAEQMETDADNPNQEAVELEVKSGRLMELERMQVTSTTLKAEIEDGASLLSSILDKSSIVGNYLEKAEKQLAQLEEVETKFSHLQTVAVKLSQKYQAMKTSLATHEKTIALLEVAKATIQDKFEKQKFETVRLAEESKAKSFEIRTNEANIAKLNDQLLAQADYERQLRDENAKKGRIIGQLKAEYRKLQSTNKAQEKENAKLSAKFEESKTALDQVKVDLGNTRSKHDEVNTLYLETKSRLEAQIVELTATNREVEEKMRLKEQRIVELCSKLEVADKKMGLSEDLIASLSHKLSEEKPTRAARTGGNGSAGKATVKDADGQASKVLN